MGICEAHTALRQSVDIRSLHPNGAITFQVAKTEVVGINHHHIGAHLQIRFHISALLRHHRFRYCRQCQHSYIPIFHIKSVIVCCYSTKVVIKKENGERIWGK